MLFAPAISTLIYELALDVPKPYLHTKNELYRSRLSKEHSVTQTDATYVVAGKLS